MTVKFYMFSPLIDRFEAMWREQLGYHNTSSFFESHKSLILEEIFLAIQVHK